MFNRCIELNNVVSVKAGLIHIQRRIKLILKGGGHWGIHQIVGWKSESWLRVRRRVRDFEGDGYIG